MSDSHLSAGDRRLVDRLSRMEPLPASVLEMGCGEGHKLVALKRSHNVDAYGVDSHEPSVSSLNKAGIGAMVGDMRNLPFDDHHFDWVLIANSLHHIPNPQDALREGARVARHGVVICEPWCDQTIESQRTTYALCQWSNALVQSLGYFHREGLSAGEILDLVDFEAASAEVFYELGIARWDVNEWLKHFSPYMDQLAETHFLRWRLKHLLGTLPTDTATEPGQVVVVIRKCAA
ncbi:ubiquinone/menaquinone biosynthesis C-methylase UbiE [Paraburkholderia sp. EB58]|jgi:ubiquinone/menaquinone biosynthesis C-methylase UbiE|uniref:class I SAM-dependent methyltransferase n=1 Tax=Paraburkholderia sp. EB58 TaxID=3035125 RepID=UPI003D1D1064